MTVALMEQMRHLRVWGNVSQILGVLWLDPRTLRPARLRWLKGFPQKEAEQERPKAKTTSKAWVHSALK